MPRISSLSDLTGEGNRDFGSILTPSSLNASMRATQNRINSLNDVAADLESAYAGATAPGDKVRGKLWADTSTSGVVQLKVDPDGLGSDNELATRLTTRLISFAAGGGGASHGVAAMFGVSMGDLSGSDSGGISLSHSQTLPASTLDADGQVLRFQDVGGIAATGSTYFQGTLNNQGTQHNIDASAGTRTAMFTRIIIRTGSTTGKSVSWLDQERDSDGNTENVIAEDLTGLDYTSGQAVQTVAHAGSIFVSGSAAIYGQIVNTAR